MEKAICIDYRSNDNALQNMLIVNIHTQDEERLYDIPKVTQDDDKSLCITTHGKKTMETFLRTTGSVRCQAKQCKFEQTHKDVCTLTNCSFASTAFFVCEHDFAK